MTAQQVSVPPDLTALTDEERRRVLVAARREGARCPTCHSRKFTVGEALYLGFLFHSEDQDAWYVALTCANRSCPSPRTGIRLRAKEFHDQRE